MSDHKITVKCKGCRKRNNVVSFVSREKFLQGYKDRGKPYLCCACWSRVNIKEPEMSKQDEARQVALSLISDAKDMATEGQKRLDELDKKPELRLGDYGIDECGSPIIYIDHDLCKRTAFTEDKMYWQPCANMGKVVWLGNIFDDLKWNSEDLDEFGIYGNYVDTMTVGISSTKRVKLKFERTLNCLDPDAAINFAQKIIQVAHTAKRKQANV